MNGSLSRVLSDQFSTSAAAAAAAATAATASAYSRLPLLGDSSSAAAASGGGSSRVRQVSFNPAYGAVEQATPSSQVCQWLKRTVSFDSTMPSFRTLVKTSRSRAEMTRVGTAGNSSGKGRKTSSGSVGGGGGGANMLLTSADQCTLMDSPSYSESTLDIHDEEVMQTKCMDHDCYITGGSPLKRDLSSKSLTGFACDSSKNYLEMRKCETVLALSNLENGSAQVTVCSNNNNNGSKRPLRTRNLLQRLSRSKPNFFRSRLSVGSRSRLGIDDLLEEQHDSGFGSGLCSGTSVGNLQPLQAVNRLRVHPESRMCSRCSSRLTLHSSKVSLNAVEDSPMALCRICLLDYSAKDMTEITQCGCWFCTECLKSYITFEIQEGAYDISCPDPQCESQGVMSLLEMERLIDSELVEKHTKFRLNREVDLDSCRTWCPRAGCETVCNLCPSEQCLPQGVNCPTCANEFCSNCKRAWHPTFTCDDVAKKRNKMRTPFRTNPRKNKFLGYPAFGIPEEDSDDDDFDAIPENSDLIKRCPACSVPIEKDAGCAQMMCKRCKHVFCWYCLESLDDDFLLRHYDKGPCKNKLGHSRASVLWHRTQVVGIFAGFGILLLVASPLLLLAAPCILCCRCKVCSRLDEELEESLGS